MKNHIIVALVSLAQTLLTASCVIHRPMVYTPDVSLDKNSQLCISIPQTESPLGESFNILAVSVFQQGVGQSWEKYYFDSADLGRPLPYYVKPGECIKFEYNFQNDQIYSIHFSSSVKRNNDRKDWVTKQWVRTLKLKIEPNGQILLQRDVQSELVD